MCGLSGAGVVKFIAEYRNGRMLTADLRGTRGADRSLGLTVPPTCYEFAGWLTWPLAVDIKNHTGNPTRIRHMCTNAFIYPCVSWTEKDGWQSSDGLEYIARLDTYGPNIGPDYGEDRCPRGSRCGPNGPYALGDVPGEWPWKDVCVDCWDFSSSPCYWFVASASVAPDAMLSTIGKKLLELMMNHNGAGMSRRIPPDEGIDFPWECFACHVAPETLCSIAYVAEVYRTQDKATKAYGNVVNIWVRGKVSVRIPLKKCDAKGGN